MEPLILQCQGILLFLELVTIRTRVNVVKTTNIPDNGGPNSLPSA